MDSGAQRAKAAILIGAAYVGLHVLLDAVSWVHGLAGFLITPWNPPAGLALAFLLLAGRRVLPAIFLGCLAADLIVRGQSFNPLISLNFALGFTGAYAACVLLLRRLRFRTDMQSLRDVLLLAGVSGAFALAAVIWHVGFLTLTGSLPGQKVLQGIGRHWVGDLIGIMTAAPAILVFWHQRREIWPLLNDLVLPLCAILAVCWIVFGLETTDEFKVFYLLFLPQIWIAVRHGLRGAVVGVAVAQGAMMGITTWMHYEAATVTALQALMMALSLTTLLLAAVVEERGRAETNLREHQMSLAQMTRLSLAGEMASGLAHELNQPLSAIVNYIKAAQGLLAQQTALGGEVKDALDKASNQAMRASQIIGRLREFLQKGALARETIGVSDLIGEALALFAPTAKRSQTRISTQLPGAPLKVLADRIHIEQVLLNLLVNASEAMDGLAPQEREIVIEARDCRDGFVEIAVLDRGPGIAPEIEGRLFEPFASSKSEGMGLGLMICRTIVETHGGELWHDVRTLGRTAFRFTLPAKESNG